MNFKLFTLTFTLFTGAVCFAQSLPQQVINATGGTYSKGHFSVDWSVGELAVVNQMQSPDGNYQLTNGFMQTITDLCNIAVINTELRKEDIRILPNPTRNMLEVDFLTNQTGSVKMLLYDMMGQLLVKKEFYLYGYGQFQKIDMSVFKAGSYTLKISLQLYQGSELRNGSYRIIKI